MEEGLGLVCSSGVPQLHPDSVLRKKVIVDFLWFAELYREDVGRRTVEDLRRARTEGKKLGRPPYPFPAEEVRRLLARGYSV